MSYCRVLRCTACGTEYPADTLMNLCPVDDRPVQMVMDTAELKQDMPQLQWYHPERPSMWRFGALLGLNWDDPADRRFIQSLGEGHTPEISLANTAVARDLGIDLWLKDEGQPHPGYGANPTLSFKDRGMSMAASMAKRFGVEKVVVPTQGNAGDSLTEYALKAGMQIAVIMPDDTPMPIQGRVAALAHRYPEQVQLELIQGTIREAGARMKEHYLPQGFFNMATFQEPGWRIEGKKTLGLEVAEPKNGSAEWQLPDVIVYPTGGGTGVLGMWKAFDELEQLGLIDAHRPRIICVQSAHTTPVVDAMRNQAADTETVDAGHTIATGLNVPGGVGQFRVLDIMRKSQGCAIAVSENAIAAVLRQTFDQQGIWISPEGAATLAALPEAAQQGVIRPADRVVAFNTGSFEKYLPNLRDILFQNPKAIGDAS